MSSEKIKAYPKTDLFEVVDTIGVPHTITIGTKHVAHASYHHSGILGEETLREIPCAHPGCRLKYAEHETALLVKCKTKETAPLQSYLKTIVEQCEKDGFAGFAFLDGTEKESS